MTDKLTARTTAIGGFIAALVNLLTAFGLVLPGWATGTASRSSTPQSSQPSRRSPGSSTSSKAKPMPLFSRIRALEAGAKQKIVRISNRVAVGVIGIGGYIFKNYPDALHQALTHSPWWACLLALLGVGTFGLVIENASKP